MTPPTRRLLRIDAFRLALAVGLVFAFLHYLDVRSLARSSEVPVVSRVENAAQDYALTHLRGPRRPSGDVVIVAVDEKSVEAEGQWPWSRAKMARLVDELAKGGVVAVGFDMVWSEEDALGRRMAEVAAMLEKSRAAARDGAAGRDLDLVLAAARGDDRRFPVDVDPTEQLAAAIERTKNVAVGFMFLGARDPAASAHERIAKLQFFRTDPVHAPLRGGRLVAIEQDASGAPRAIGLPFAGVVPPVDTILSVADCGGFFNHLPDADGTIRRYTVVARAGDAMFPSLGVAVLAKALAREGIAQRVVPVGEESGERVIGVEVGATEIETDGAGRVPLNYYGSYRDFPSWSATDVINGRIPAADARGKIAVVGNTAVGTWDQRVTPFDDIAPGVVTHATFLENVLHGELLRRGGGVVMLELGLMTAVAFGLAWVFSRVKSAAAAPALLAAVAVWVLFAVVALRRWNVVFALGLPVAQMFSMFLAATSYRFFTEEKEKRRARETFSRFLAPAMVDEVLAQEGGIRLGGEKRDLTVLFSDIRGFTSLSERLDPHVLLELLNEYLTPMTDVIVSDHQGTLDKYIGDAIMAFWGAPKELPDHALRACKAALAMLERLAALRPQWAARGLPDIDIGIGINTGPMSVGFVGSQDRFYNYTVLGDAVNLASRLEGANRQYGTHVIISAATYLRVKDAVVVRELDAVRVKGKREPVVIYELLALEPPAPPLAAFLEQFTWGLSAYKAQRWDEAIAHFRAAGAQRPGDACTQNYVTRCEAMRLAPPGPGWDGVYELKTK